ncbi:MAG: O-antigen ligase domain-containing protein [Bradyrhizobium sp.]|jgi:O-antigen ligase|uniref:O-antigen ligase family protein n=1 Tax=Bradyrhizobium sp. TaxID=376 RepID=UPI001203F230|nr:O-antigen ligase family protein [Bradyrhizobium sp.]THD50414.1 MAG: O-antigen ligase domain-containing protein [Bradyrhizobium sp.]
MNNIAPAKSFLAGTDRFFRVATRSRFWQFCRELYPAMMAAALPWSTTAVTVFLILWLVTLVPTIDPPSFLRTLRRPAALLPVIFVTLTVIGMLWAEGSWSAAFHGLAPAAKLLILPLLLYQYQYSARSYQVFIAFLVSCTLLLFYSWLIVIVPEWRLTMAHGFDTTGVPVRNTIDQNQEFALCAFALASLAVSTFRRRQQVAAVVIALLAATFLCNIIFVALARTSLVYIVPLTIIFVFWHFDRRMALVTMAGLTAGIVMMWISSPYLRGRVENIAVEYREYRETNRPTSTGQRLTYWKESVGWISEAPVIGHGTGSAKQLFEAAAIGKEGAWADRISNPHNQTLYVAIQWGLLGCILLYAIWYFHCRLFLAPGLVAWIGFTVVAQNILSSLLNSHLFDFSEGWMYVLGVGASGGFMFRSENESDHRAA